MRGYESDPPSSWDACRSFTVLPTSKAQDPSGAYIARWVPELAELPAKHRHEPWAAPPDMLAAAGVELGRTYPHRVTGDVSLQVLRHRTMDRIRLAKTSAGAEWQDADGYDLIEAPQASSRIARVAQAPTHTHTLYGSCVRCWQPSDCAVRRGGRRVRFWDVLQARRSGSSRCPSAALALAR